MSLNTSNQNSYLQTLIVNHDAVKFGDLNQVAYNGFVKVVYNSIVH